MNRGQFLKTLALMGAATTLPKSSDAANADVAEALGKAEAMTQQEFKEILRRGLYKGKFEELASKAGHLREFTETFLLKKGKESSEKILLNGISPREALQNFEENPVPVGESGGVQEVEVGSSFYSEITVPTDAPYSLRIVSSGGEGVDAMLPQDTSTVVLFSNYTIEIIGGPNPGMKTTSLTDIAGLTTYDLSVVESGPLPIELISQKYPRYNSDTGNIEWEVSFFEKNVESMKVEVSPDGREPWTATYTIPPLSTQNGDPVRRDLNLEFDNIYYGSVYVRIRSYDYPNSDGSRNVSEITGVRSVVVPFDDMFYDKPIFSTDKIEFIPTTDLEILVTGVMGRPQIIKAREGEQLSLNPRELMRGRSGNILFFNIHKQGDDQWLPIKIPVI